MAVRQTERTLPKGFTASDLGQAFVSADKRFSLISYLTDPIAVGSLVEYVVFVEDAAVANTCETYQWTVWEDAGDGPREAQQDTTEEGLFAFRPTQLGHLMVAVEVCDAGGNTIQMLALNQTVVPPHPDLEDLLANESVLSVFGGHPATSREVVNDLSQYIVEAVCSPYRGRFLEIPDLLLAAEVYKEALWRPKEFEFWRDYLTYAYELRRDIELGLAAEELNGEMLSSIRVQIDNSLGVCQIKPQTLAMVLKKSGADATYTEWLEKPQDESKRADIETKQLANFNALPLADKIDLYNLLRFPKTNVLMCCLVLDRLKERPNRWPGLAKKALLDNEKALKIIATEYNLGATETARDAAQPSSYGSKIFGLLGAPFLKLIRYRFKSYLGKEFTIQNANAIVRNDDLSPKTYQAGDTLPDGKHVGDQIVIPDGSTVLIKGISADLKYVVVEGYGLTAASNLKEPLFNETVDVAKAAYVSADAKNRTVGDASAVIRTPASSYAEVQPRRVIPQGKRVTKLQTAQDGAGSSFVQVSADGAVLGWTAAGNLASQPDASGKYEVTNADARIRTRDYTSTAAKLDQGSYVIVKAESPDTMPLGQYVQVAFTKPSAGGAFVEDTGKPPVWTAATNLVAGWADFRGPNAAWKGGNYIGQLDVVSIIGRDTGLVPQIDKIAGDTVAPFLRLVRAAANDKQEIILTSGFRTYAEQQDLWTANPNPAQVAPPGKSNHQNGVAFDLKTDDFNTPVYNWLKDHATSYGFVRTVDNEHWHWEYRPQDAAARKALNDFKLEGVSP